MTTETATCQECGHPFERSVNVVLGIVFSLKSCPACMAKADAATQAAEQASRQKQLEEEWARICPPAYRETDPASPLLNESAKAIASRWDAATARRGLGLIGKTGAGKTRLLFATLKRAHWAGRSCAAISHNRFSRIVADAYSGQNEERAAAKAVLARLYSSSVVLLDDLGKAPSTERANAELEELVEARTSALKPILWTSNAGGQWLIARFGADMGEPIVRRLGEFCEVHHLDGK